MPDSIFDLSATDKPIDTKISLVASKEVLKNFGTLTYTAEKGNDIYKITFSFSSGTKIDISIQLPLLSKTSCLILCGIGLIGPILDCYKKNKNNWTGFKRCLKDQGHTLGATTLVCVTSCLSNQ